MKENEATIQLVDDDVCDNPFFLFSILSKQDDLNYLSYLSGSCHHQASHSTCWRPRTWTPAFPICRLYAYRSWYHLCCWQHNSWTIRSYHCRVSYIYCVMLQYWTTMIADWLCHQVLVRCLGQSTHYQVSYPNNNRLQQDWFIHRFAYKQNPDFTGGWNVSW